MSRNSDSAPFLWKRVKEVAAAALLAPFLAIGWLAGSIIKAARLSWAAVVEGFEAGRKL